jgi:hypothetical protein
MWNICREVAGAYHLPPQRAVRRKTPVAHATTSSPTGSFADIQLLVSTKPKIIGCIDTNPRLCDQLR